MKSPLKFTIALPLLPLKGFLKHIISQVLSHSSTTPSSSLATVRASHLAFVSDYVPVINADIELKYFMF